MDLPIITICIILNLTYIYLYQKVSNVHMLSYYCLAFFHFNLKNSISYRADLVMTNSLCSCLGKIYISLSFLKDSFDKYSILSALCIYHPIPFFCWEICCWSHEGSLVCDKLAFFCFFQDSPWGCSHPTQNFYVPNQHDIF